MKTYAGLRGPGGCAVTVDGLPLPLRLDLANHSPTGFEWGYGGSGPAQLAIAILADFLGPGNEDRVRDIYQDFKWSVVAKLPRERWTLTGSHIVAALAGALTEARP